MRFGVAVASWAAAVSLVQSLGGEVMMREHHPLEERIEQRLKGVTAPPPQAKPEHTHEDESFEPWELVSV